MGVPEPVKKLVPSGSEALGHPGLPGSCGRAENGVGAHGLDLAQSKGGRGKELRLVPVWLSFD